jgi:hypothetical protein
MTIVSALSSRATVAERRRPISLASLTLTVWRDSFAGSRRRVASGRCERAEGSQVRLYGFVVTFMPMTSTRRSIRFSAAIASAVVGLTLAVAPANTATAATKTKLVCKTVKGKRKCTRIKVKAASKKAAEGTDAMAAKDTVAPASADTTIKK